VFVEPQSWMYRAGEHPQGDQEYLELLTRVVFAAGLGPRVVASRWEGMREALGGFDPRHLGGLEPADVDRLLADPRMIRNRRKIEAAGANARAFSEVLAEYGAFSEYLESLGIRRSFAPAVQDLTERFRHLGDTSAVLFLFSAGWRDLEEEEAPILPDDVPEGAPAAVTDGGTAQGPGHESTSLPVEGPVPAGAAS
jgi:3-methyladenine DNA glycosylase Tag